ncbi:MAG: OmpA family protein [Amylibacter sp.]|nr:OmpA family protein [Amylibacter sp.]
MFLSRLLPLTLACAVLSSTAWAGQITLKSTSSSVELIGKFKGYKNGVYTIETDLGELEVDARTVTCEGRDCPSISSLVSKFAITGNQAVIDTLLVPLLESYSFSLDAKIETKIKSDTKSNILISAKDGQDFADISVQSGAGDQLKNPLIVKSGTTSALPGEAGKTKITPLALDALVAITSDTNLVKSISLEAIHAVLSGSISNWKKLGGPDVAINLYLPQKTSDLAKTADIMGFDISKVKATERFDDLNELAKVVADDPYGLGFINFASRRNATLLPVLGSCGASVRPSSFSISTGSYPATFQHYLEANVAELPIFAREFLSYLTGGQAGSLIERQGYPSLSISETSMENQGNRIIHSLLATSRSVPSSEFRTMLKTLKTARQLSTVFRFNTDGTTLDIQSKAAFDALISELFLGNFADQTIMVVGFTGAEGSTRENKRTSKVSAQLVSDLIKNADSDGLLADLQIETLGFGEASPLACEDTANGIATNNRVEIWVKGAF